MTIRHLDRLFRPKSIAVIGASPDAHAIGYLVLSNILRAGFSGPILPVNPKYGTVAGLECFSDVASLPEAPDLAIICTPPPTVPGLIGELGRRGTKAAAVFTAGLNHGQAESGKTLQQAMLDAAKPHLLRVLGPNSIGLLVPGARLNASFAHVGAEPGKIAFLSQSGALCTIVLDWARQKAIGFSHFVSLGDSADVDFGDVIDYLAADADTRAILLYIESVKQARKFMSAARAAARNKPVLAIKAGRALEGQRAAASHTGAMAGSDTVYSAAFRRAGIVRVDTIDELFAAAETLARTRRLPGERLAILSNGGGPGVMAVDALVQGGGHLARLAPATIAELNQFLPATWSGANPVDIIGDATPQRHAAALKVLLKDPDVDAILIMHAPTAVATAEEVAVGVIAAAAGAEKNILTCWLGGDGLLEARRQFGLAQLPSYDTPESAVRAFLHMVEYHHSQIALMQTPPAAATAFSPNTAVARSLIDTALAQDRTLLSEIEAKQVLAAYGVPVVPTLAAADADQAVAAAERLGFPVALKILSPDLTHKSDVGGVRLDLNDGQAVRKAASEMQARVRHIRPDARLEGFTVQVMEWRRQAFELILGVATDPIFGPVILIGQGGTAAEIVADRAVALPPLNLVLAKDLISRTRISRLLAGYRGQAAVDLDGLALALVRISQLVVDFPELTELDVNPLLIDSRGMVALDARMVLSHSYLRGAERLAISPYPQWLEESFVMKDGRAVMLRPIRPEDEPEHQVFFSKLNPEDVRFRFFGMVRDLPHSEVARFTQIDYSREMAFIATAPDAAGKPETLGVVRIIADPDGQQAEFAVIVRSDVKERGLGHALLEKMIRYCRERGIGALFGRILPENHPMRALAAALGFQTHTLLREHSVEARLNLRQDADPAAPRD